MLDKTYQPAQIEPRVTASWERAEAFRCRRPDQACRQAVRHRHPAAQCHGRAAHGACAQQHAAGRALPLRAHARPRRALATGHRSRRHRHADGRRAPAHGAPGADRRTLGREEFVRRVWAWKEESGGAIVNQLKRLGASCDWSRERFTMDPGLSRAVVKVFVELYRAGLIYKDKRLVNWDPKFQTAIPIWRWCRSRRPVLMGRRQSGEAVRWWRSPRSSTRTQTGTCIISLSPDGAGQGLRQGLHRRRNDAARDDAGRHWRRRTSHGSALRRVNQGQGDGDAAARRPRDPDRGGRVFRSNEGHGRGQDHARARLQRLRRRQAALSTADQRTRRVGQDRFAAR